MIDNPNRQWAKILDSVKDNLSSSNYKIWFSQTTLDPTSNGTLVVNVPSAFVKDNLLSKYMPVLEQALEKVLGEIPPVDFRVNPGKVNKNTDEEEGMIFTAQPTTFNPTTAGLNSKYTMESFVVGLSNNLAYAASQAVIQNPGTSYNPLFIYGGTGVGKTHLMQAVGNALLQRNHNLKVIYCSSERFMNDFIESIQNKRTGDFRSKYRSCDLLLIDDIQFISGRDSTQEEFFHTFNELQSKNAQIILTSDRIPSDIQKLEPRLASRFQGGLMVDIQIPDRDTRVAILKAKCMEKNAPVSNEILELIAENIVTNARELEGKLMQIIQSHSLLKQELTAESVAKYLGSNISVSTNKPLNIDPKRVLGGIAQYFNVKPAELTGPRRNKELVTPRQIAMFILYEDCKVPFEKIGAILGGRDHTTIMHGVNKLKESQGRDREIQRIMIEVKQHLSTI